MAQRVTSYPGKTVTIDGIAYRLDGLSQEAVAELTSLRVTDQSIQQVQHRLAMLQSARAVYARALNGLLTTPPDRRGEAEAAAVKAPATRVFWHNVGLPENSWWRYLVSSGQVAAGFDNSRGDAGESLMQRYRSGDALIAYARGKGAVGWARVEAPCSYRLVEEGSRDDRAAGDLRHRLSVIWQAAAQDIDQAVSAADIRRDFGIRHPTHPSVAIELDMGGALLEHLNQCFARLP